MQFPLAPHGVQNEGRARAVPCAMKRMHGTYIETFRALITQLNPLCALFRRSIDWIYADTDLQANLDWASCVWVDVMANICSLSSTNLGWNVCAVIAVAAAEPFLFSWADFAYILEASAISSGSLDPPTVVCATHMWAIIGRLNERHGCYRLMHWLHLSLPSMPAGLAACNPL